MIVLNNEQENAVTGLLSFIKDDNYREAMLVGPAGTGKTTVINNFLDGIFQDRDLFQFYKEKIIILAPTHKAKNVVYETTSKKGNALSIPYSTIHSALGLRPTYDSPELVFDQLAANIVSDYNLIIVDEASMVFDKLYELIVRSLRESAKVIFVGDPYQLPPVGQSRISRSIAKRKNCVMFKLDTVERFNDSEIHKITKLLRDEIKEIWINNKGANFPIPWDVSKTIHSIERLVDRTMPFFQNQLETIVCERPYLNGIKILTYRNNTKNLINDAIRSKLFNKSKVPAFMNNDVIVLDSPTSDKLFDNNEEAIVNRAIPFEYAREFEVFRKEEELDDDREQEIVKIKIPCWKLEVFKYDYDGNKILSNIVAIAQEDRAILEKQKKELANTILKFENRSLFAKYYYPFLNQLHIPDYAYCVTVHKSQGSSYDYVFVHEADIDAVKPITDLEKLQTKYVACTRLRKELYIVR